MKSDIGHSESENRGMQSISEVPASEIGTNNLAKMVAHDVNHPAIGKNRFALGGIK